jgi:hypothetical protein
VWTINCSQGGCASKLAGLTFDGALNGSSGSTLCDADAKLFQQAVAALLSACSLGGNYPLTDAQIRSEVQTALDSCNRATVLAEATRLQQFNSLPCPLGTSAPTTLQFRK